MTCPELVSIRSEQISPIETGCLSLAKIGEGDNSRNKFTSVFSYCERLTELKAIWKSIWSTTSSDWPPTVLLYVIFDEWMTASEPPLTLITNCSLSNSSTVSHLASLAKNFAMRRGNISLTAIGRTPLFFLDRAVSEVQQSALEKKAGKCPLLPKFTNFVIAFIANTDRPGAVQSTACCRCSGNILEGPDAVCLLNVFNCS